jgi:carboxypeptidase D
MPGNPHRKSPTAGNNDEGTSHPSTQHVARRGAVAEIAARAATRGMQTRKKGQSDNSSPTGLADRLSGSIDPWYGCELFDEMVDYAVNYTWPWSAYTLRLEKRC